jgi:hypothetical protein
LTNFNFKILLEYPLWFVLICIIAGIGFSAILYYRSQADYLSLNQKRMLAVFRFVAITLISLLLLSPLLEIRQTRTEEPLVIFFQDNSLSLISGRDSIYMLQEYPLIMDNISSRLSRDFGFLTYSFGERNRIMDTLDYQDKITDMSDIFSSLKTLYHNRNIGAVILASDGIFNRGVNPLYEASSARFPVYTIALGDTIPQRDLIINRLKHNTLTYLNNIFPLEITIEATQAQGQSSVVRVLHNNQVEFEQRISFESDHHFETVMARLEARETGLKRYKVEVVPIENEISVTNNVQEFFIEVIDSRQKILILANSPHPDIAAIKLALEDNENYEVEVFLLQDFNDNVQDFDLLIWHQLPSTRFVTHPVFGTAASSGIPQVFILGPQTNLQAFNRLQTGVQVTPRSAGFNDARGDINENFTLFSISDDTRKLLPLLPPLNTAFANYNLAPATQNFIYQKIGNVVTDYPLITFTEAGERKTMVIAGEGIWRWRMGSFARNSTHEPFNELISKMIQYVSVVEDKSFFRVNTRNFLYENEQAIFEAELYNRSYELVNEPEVILVITNEDGVEFDYVFGRTINAYTLNAGSFPVGEYNYMATVEFGQDIFEAQGMFSVSPLNIEGTRTLANHQLLYQISSNTGAELFYPEQWEQLTDHIHNRQDIRPVLYSQKEFKDIINLKWIFFLVLILISVEWFVRKFSGGY